MLCARRVEIDVGLGSHLHLTITRLPIPMTFRTLPDTDELPRALYTAAQVRGFDRLAIEHFGIPGLTLMERAGQAAFDLLRAALAGCAAHVVLAGTGNNGGDGFVVARLARQAGLEVRCCSWATARGCRAMRRQCSALE